MLNRIQANIAKNEELYKIFRQDSHLPKAPTDIEKYIYKNGDFKLYAIVALIVSALAVFGQVIWILNDKDRLPFLIPVFIFTLFSLLTYGGAFAKRSFNRQKHEELANKFYNSTNFPSVDVYLTTCGEEIDVLNNAYQYVSQLQWKGKLRIHVLDDKGNHQVQALASKYNFNYLHRPDPGVLKKAGNIRYAFTRTQGDYFVIFDADFCPRSDFLMETMPYFLEDTTIGLLQTPQYFHLTENSNFIEVGSTAKEELFYRCIQPSRDSFSSAMCVGTNAIYKREAVTKMGGVAPLEHSEDIHTGFNLVTDGWKIKYLPLVLAKGMAPSTVNAYFSQQYRWGLGTLMQLFDKDFWFAKIPFLIKLNYINSIFYYLNVSTGVIFNIFPIILSVMFFSGDIKADEVIVFLPLFIFTYIFHPLWQKTPWSIKCVSANLIANTAYLFALFDLITGSVMEWVPTGQAPSKSGKKTRYYQFLWFLGLWHITAYSLVLYFAVMNMTAWDDYRMYPIIFFATFYLIVTLGVFEPINKIKNFAKTLMTFAGIRIMVTQLGSVSLIVILLGIFTSMTVLAVNKEGRSNIINTLASISIIKSTKDTLVPVPVFTVAPAPKTIVKEKEVEIVKKELDTINQVQVQKPVIVKPLIPTPTPNDPIIPKKTEPIKPDNTPTPTPTVTTPTQNTTVTPPVTIPPQTIEPDRTPITTPPSTKTPVDNPTEPDKKQNP